MSRSLTTVARLAAACAFGLGLVRGSTQAGEYRAPLLAAPPEIDGRIEGDEWSGAVRIDGLLSKDGLERRKARVWVGATAEHIHAAIWSQLPDEGDLLAEVHRDVENLVFDDSVEVWIDPEPDRDRGRTFQMLVNPLGHRWYKLHPRGGLPEEPGWRGGWKVETGLHEGGWHVEASIPLGSVAPGRRADQGLWALNVCRNWKREWAWSSLRGAEYRPVDRFAFSEEPGVAISLEERGDPFLGDVRWALVVRNPSVARVSVRAALELERDLMPGIKERRPLDLGPGESREVELRVTDRSTRKFALRANVTSEDETTTIFSRGAAWSAAEPWRWTTRKREIPPVDFRFAYYPYSDRLRVLADVSNLPRDAVLETLSGVVRERGGEDAVASFELDDPRDARQELELSLPPLEGEYEIVLKASGKNVPEAEVVKPFERRVFEWERGSRGRSTRVYPPFTPLRVDGKHVASVLREHSMTDDGLWSQAVAAGRPLLAAPMRWEARAGGEPEPVEAAELRFARVEEHEVLVESSWTAGPLKASATVRWEVDGMMRVDLRLEPTGGRALDSLDLVIPLRSEHATHIHAMGDGIRNTIYTRIPDRVGRVWSSEEVQANDLPAGFASYVYAGTPVRGLSWFAENDRGWRRRPGAPNVELVRSGERTEMRIHLIGEPGPISAAREITFGLLAAPVKPRLPSDWRHRYRRERYSLLGTDINWLALGDCGSVYPAGKDLFLWEMIARGNRERLSEDDIRATIERGRPFFEPYGKERVDSFVAHVRHNLTARHGARMIFYYNRASFQAAEELETFKDEWGLTDYRAIGKGDGIGEIKIVPSDSYIDHALYWYGKSFDVGGNQGVYWDNWFFVGSYNTEMTGAYRRDDGSVAPSTGIWGLRELCKRTFQYLNERGMFPLTMPHMTSTGILPLLSFATVQYDWEWKYSEGDVQDRFSREYILLVSNGELAGTWPVLLGDHGPLASDPWTARTFAGVAMVHELDCPYPSYSEAGRAQLALLEPVDRVLALPGVRAYRYWDDAPQPVRAEDPDLPAVVYSVEGKETVVAIVSYAREDRAARLRIDAQALGLEDGFRLLDAETGRELPSSTEGARLSVRRHDVRVLRLVSP